VANSKQSKKRAIQAEKRRVRNASKRSAMRTFMKKVIAAAAEGNKEVATKAFQEAVSAIDKMASKGLIHKGTANRYKSRLSAKVKAVA
jgi:small subunit ribosomal protein S20